GPVWPETDEDPHAWIAALPPAAPVPSTPDVSIIIPVFNHADRLPACIASALTQTAVSVEAVIVDDCSTDPRIAPMLAALAQARPDVTLITNRENLGISQAQNLAADAARGRYLAFLDCDDMLAADALMQVLARMRPGVGYAFTDRIDVDAEGGVLRTAVYGGYPHIRPGGAIGDDLLDGMVASHLKVIERNAYLVAGGCDPAFDGVQDWELALRLHDRGVVFQHVPAAVYRHTIHAASVTSSSSVRQFWR
ncbi:glycosyltransferase, partial [Aphanothece microscopica]|uniref:glycosyltransferase n=1 Tax=Aphanothece microscopica TaxID=1049561 RepID=UPI00398476C4